MFTVNRMVASPSRPPTRDRTSNCTHLHVTRLFDVFGCDQCSICHRRPQLGWLFRCVQDSDGFLPASDFFDVQDHKRFDHDAQLYTLSPSVTKAAADGHYTDAQLDVLWEQKIEVRKTIQQVWPVTSSAASTTSSSLYSLPASITTSTIHSSCTDPDTELSQLSDYLQSCRGPLEPIQEVHDDLEIDRCISPSAGPTPPPPCNFRVCQTCRPIYQQRAWHSINGVLISPHRLPPKHELENRRISDVRLVRKLGLDDTRVKADSRTLCAVNVDRSKRNSRTQFQDIVQQLLSNSDQPSQDKNPSAVGMDGIELKAVADNLQLDHPTCRESSCEDNFSEQTSRASSTFLRPLWHRRGFERFASIQAPARKAESQSGDSTSSIVLSTNHSNQSCPAAFGLCIDTKKANALAENVSPPEKTPTESIKESLYRLGVMKKCSTRFAID